MLIWHLPVFRHIEFHLHPVGIFREAHPLHVLRVIRIVIDGSHRAKLVETLYQHTFSIEVGKAQRTLYLCHTPLLTPVFHRLNQGIRHFRVINEVYPSETYGLCIPGLISTFIDERSYPAYQFAILISQEIISLAKLKRSILILAEGIQHVLIQVWHRIGIILIHFVVEADKLLQLTFTLNFLYCNSHILTQVY